MDYYCFLSDLSIDFPCVSKMQNFSPYEIHLFQFLFLEYD